MYFSVPVENLKRNKVWNRDYLKKMHAATKAKQTSRLIKPNDAVWSKLTKNCLQGNC